MHLGGLFIAVTTAISVSIDSRIQMAFAAKTDCENHGITDYFLVYKQLINCQE